MIRLAVLIFLLQSICSVFSQGPSIYFDHISDQQGLNDHWINCLLQDNKGFIWIGGENGLYRFDGYKTVLYKDPPGCSDCPHFYPVYDIIEDNRFLLWTISYKGITIYNPEIEKASFIYAFKKINSAGNSFKFSTPLDLMKDSYSNVWATGDGKLLKFSYKVNGSRDKSPSNFKMKEIPDIDQFYLSRAANSSVNQPLKIIEDSDGNIWTLCVDALYVLRKGDSSFQWLDLPAEMKTVTITNFRDILELNDKSFLIISDGIIYQMKNAEEALMRPVINGSSLQFRKIDPANNQISWRLQKDSKNNIFIGTDLDVYEYSERTEADNPVFESLYSRMFDEKDYQNSKGVQCIMEDRSGMLWIGHRDFGLIKFSPWRAQFRSCNYKEGKVLADLNINILHTDGRGNLWVGAWGKGLYRFGIKSGELSMCELGVYGKYVICMEEIRPGIFWLGLSDQGVLEYNTLTGDFHDPLDHGRVESNLRRSQVNDILKDQNQICLTSSLGIFVYDIPKKRLSEFSYPDNDSVRARNNWTISPVKLRDGRIIAYSPYYGLCKIHYDADAGKISVNSILSDSILLQSNLDPAYLCRLYQDHNGTIWLVEKSGLNRIDPEKGEILHFRLFNNIDFPDAWSIAEDDSDNLWIGTHFGLCRFNLKTGIVKNFTKADGLPVSWHQYNTVCKDQDGNLYFAGIGGFYSFNPDSIKANTEIPSVVITELRLFNKPLRVDTTKNAILTKSMPYTSIIELSHNQNDLSFEFAALDFTIPSRNLYAYKLEGYQDSWVETDADHRTATYTNLNPGKYTFLIKGSNCDGVWNEAGASLTIIIHKPWYGTFIAWFLYIVIFLTGLAGFVRWRLHKLKGEKVYLEKQVHERTLKIEEQREKILAQKNTVELQNRQITEHEQLRSRFFANVSHEFRTPLSLIQSPVEEMLDDPRCRPGEKKKLNMIHRNARRLLNLVNQLLDISKIDASKMRLELAEDDIMKYIRALSGSFCSLADRKKITYSMQFTAEEMITWFDPDKLEKIATNLLSNAFKFTPVGGKVVIKAGYLKGKEPGIKHFLELSVQDNGPGIPVEGIEKVFDRFYQVEESMKKEGAGTGIGLSLARDLAHLMHGDITVESNFGEGTVFTATIPIGKDHLEDYEFMLMKEAPETINYIPEIYENNDVSSDKPEIKRVNGKPVLLIVEDNHDIRIQLSDNLNSQYVILEASDGIAGLKKAREMVPDLIITDVMMPGMDGVEMCEKLKNDVCTSHIPIIVLTAKVSSEDKIGGFQSGADDYVSKPFNMNELKARVANLIEQRRKLRERYCREITLQPQDILITPLDEKFINATIEIVEKHLHDEDFRLLQLREEMHMTRSTFFRKLHALTNQSPGEFIRCIRLKRAAILLKQDYGNITQVSFAVGFNNLTSFNRAFKKLYGVSPAAYRKQDQDKG